MHSPHFSFVWDLVLFIMYASCSHGWVVTLLPDCDWNSVHVDHCLTSASNCQIGNWQISTKLWWSLIFLMLMVSRLKEIVLIFHFTYLSYTVNQTTGFFCFILVFFLFSLGFWYLSHAFWLVAVLLSGIFIFFFHIISQIFSSWLNHKHEFQHSWKYFVLCCSPVNDISLISSSCSFLWRSPVLIWKSPYT